MLFDYCDFCSTGLVVYYVCFNGEVLAKLEFGCFCLLVVNFACFIFGLIWFVVCGDLFLLLFVCLLIWWICG